MLQIMLLWDNAKHTAHYDQNKDQMHKHEKPLQKQSATLTYNPLLQHPCTLGNREKKKENLPTGLPLYRSTESLNGAEATAEQCASEPRGSSDTLVEKQPNTCHKVPNRHLSVLTFNKDTLPVLVNCFSFSLAAALLVFPGWSGFLFSSNFLRFSFSFIFKRFWYFFFLRSRFLSVVVFSAVVFTSPALFFSY